MEAVAQRLETRLPVAVRVDLWSLDVRQRAQECVTENISTHGARVVSSKPWKRNERLNLHSVQGHFRARARVAYCEPLGVNSFAIGLRLLAATGKWN
ncbi:MAG: PilZ domain-containing protein [Candidatus Acidiferrum sp.]